MFASFNSGASTVEAPGTASQSPTTAGPEASHLSPLPPHDWQEKDTDNQGLGMGRERRAVYYTALH